MCCHWSAYTPKSEEVFSGDFWLNERFNNVVKSNHIHKTYILYNFYVFLTEFPDFETGVILRSGASVEHVVWIFIAWLASLDLSPLISFIFCYIFSVSFWTKRCWYLCVFLCMCILKSFRFFAFPSSFAFLFRLFLLILFSVMQFTERWWVTLNMH